MNEDCAQNVIVLISSGLQIASHFSYLSGKYESSCRLSCTSRINGVKY
jgi:hypothetical protein